MLLTDFRRRTKNHIMWLVQDPLPFLYSPPSSVRCLHDYASVWHAFRDLRASQDIPLEARTGATTLALPTGFPTPRFRVPRTHLAQVDFIDYAFPDVV